MPQLPSRGIIDAFARGRALKFQKEEQGRAVKRRQIENDLLKQSLAFNKAEEKREQLSAQLLREVQLQQAAKLRADALTGQDLDVVNKNVDAEGLFSIPGVGGNPATRIRPRSREELQQNVVDDASISNQLLGAELGVRGEAAADTAGGVARATLPVELERLAATTQAQSGLNEETREFQGTQNEAQRQLQATEGQANRDTQERIATDRNKSISDVALKSQANRKEIAQINAAARTLNIDPNGLNSLLGAGAAEVADFPDNQSGSPVELTPDLRQLLLQTARAAGPSQIPGFAEMSATEQQIAILQYAQDLAEEKGWIRPQ